MRAAFTSARKSPILVFLLLFVVALAAYFRILNNALVSDDYFFVNGTSAMPVSELGRVFTILQMLLRPLPILLWWFQSHLFGGEGLPSHLIDITLHTGAATAFYLLLSKCGCATRTALLAAVLFVLAPAGPDAVTWSAARMDTMPLLFVLVAIILYLGYLGNGSRYAIAGSLLACGAALLSKEEAIILVFIMPATEALFGSDASPRTASAASVFGGFSGDRLRAGIGRLVPFYLVFLGYFVLRWALIGGVGGYTNLVGMPRIGATASSVWTFLSPMNNLIFSKNKIVLFGLVTITLWTLSTFLVVRNWRRTSLALRRLWLLFAFFLAVSPLPVFWFFFVVGLDHGMRDSRFFYFSSLPFIAMIVTGLLEFGGKSRIWRNCITILLLLSALACFWVLQGNNRLWEHASTVVTTVSDETVRIIPDPPLNTSFYYKGLDDGLGVHIFGTNLQELIRWKYGRRDLRVSRLEPELDGRRDAPVYFFTYDDSTDELRQTSMLPALDGP